MRSLIQVITVLLALIELSAAATTYDIEAKKFVTDTSARYFQLYNEIANETYAATDGEDFDVIFSVLTTVKRIAKELVEISEEAAGFNLNKITDEQTKSALKQLRSACNLFILGEEYFSSIVLNLAALEELATDKDIEPYLGGKLQPNQNTTAIAYYPDIQKIFEKSSNANELQYYWETWRTKNLVWSSVNLYTIIQSFQKAAKILHLQPLDLWYGSYNDNEVLPAMENVMKELKPAYEQLHAFVRQQLYNKYGADVIDPNAPIPDHLFQQVLDQVWKEGSVIESFFPYENLPPYDKFVENYDARKMVDESERFYTSLGFSPLEESFYKDRLKAQNLTENNNCRANIFDLTPQAYMAYCPNVDFKTFLQIHGYLGRIYYAQEKKDLPSYHFLAYDLEFPLGEAVILSASSPKHLSSLGLSNDFKFTDDVMVNRLFRMGIHTLFNIPKYFVHTKIMNDVLNGTIQIDSMNQEYWKLMVKYAGVEPPVNREAGAIDFPYKFYLDIEDNHQAQKFIGEVLGYQFYQAFCEKSGPHDALHNCDFYGSVAVGNDMKSMMSLGSSKPMTEVLSTVLKNNAKLSADALLAYYKPLIDWLTNSNTNEKVKIGWNATKKIIN